VACRPASVGRLMSRDGGVKNWTSSPCAVKRAGSLCRSRRRPRLRSAGPKPPPGAGCCGSAGGAALVRDVP
jgi:hypothetical protein